MIWWRIFDIWKYFNKINFLLFVQLLHIIVRFAQCINNYNVFFNFAENIGEGCPQFRGLAYVPRIYVSVDVLRVIRDIADKKVNTNPAKLTCTVVSVTPTRVHYMSNTSRFNDETANTIVTNVFGKIRIDVREILLLF